MIIFRVDSRKAETKLMGIKQKLPQALGDAGYEITRRAQKNIRYEITRQNLKWRGNLWQSVRAERKSKYTSVLHISQEGLWLDNMKPHYVKLKRGRLIRQWVLEKGHRARKWLANINSEPSIFVRPHPFINAPMQLTNAQIPKIVKDYADRAMVEA